MGLNENDLLVNTLPGEEIHIGRIQWEENFERPWKLWRSSGSEWAVYLLEGEIFSQSKIESIRKSVEVDVKPLIIVTEKIHISAIAKEYFDIRPYILCEIAGIGKLIEPLPEEIISKFKNKQVKSLTRIPVSLLREILIQKYLPIKLQRKINKLLLNYQDMQTDVNNDDYEQEILNAFGESIVRNMGFKKEDTRATNTIRKLELSKLISNKDHFFHSFNNYFIGLLAICKLINHFNNWKETTSGVTP